MNLTVEKEKRIVARDQEVIFTNWTEKDFTGVWIYGPDKKGEKAVKKAYPLKAGKSYYLPFYLAERFAREIADREYWTAFNKKLEEKREESKGMIERRQLEHLVQNDNEIRKLSRQEMTDRCVELIPEGEFETLRPREIPIKEVVLKREERAEELRERFPGIEIEGVNETALRQSEKEEEFEEEKQ